jgi:hypothetical protein
MKNQNLIIGAVVIGGLGYYAWKKGLLKSLFGDKSTESKTPATGNNPLTDPYSFASKVAKIQSYLGVQIDGIPGPQTNGALRTKYGLPYGNISMDNVDKYIKDLRLDSVIITSKPSPTATSPVILPPVTKKPNVFQTAVTAPITKTTVFNPFQTPAKAQ